MRSLTPGMLTFLQGKALVLCICVKITRKDGEIFAFTSNNKNLTFETVTYKTSSAFQPTSLKQSLGSPVDNMEIFAALSDNEISIDDVRAGLYNEAKVELIFLNQENLSLEDGYMIRSDIGDLSVDDLLKLNVKLRGFSGRMKQQIGITCESSCNVKRLFNGMCKADPTGTRDTVTVTSVSSSGFSISFTSARAADYFLAGIIKSTSGLNDEVEREIERHTVSSGTATVVLSHPFYHEVEVGDTFLVEKGCIRTFDACKTFVETGTGLVNTINFQGSNLLTGNANLVRP